MQEETAEHGTRRRWVRWCRRHSPGPLMSATCPSHLWVTPVFPAQRRSYWSFSTMGAPYKRAFSCLCSHIVGSCVSSEQQYVDCGVMDKSLGQRPPVVSARHLVFCARALLRARERRIRACGLRQVLVVLRASWAAVSRSLCRTAQ